MVMTSTPDISPDISAQITDLAEAVRASTGPLAIRLRSTLAAAIRAGVLPADRPLPPERDLAAQLGVSRSTLRVCLKDLADMGLVFTRHGAGTLVAGTIPKALSRLSGFTEDVSARGLRPTSDILECRRGPVTADTAMRTGLALGSQVLTLVRLRRADGEALSFEEVVVPVAAVGPGWDGTGSLYDEMDSLGTRPRRMLQTLEAVAAPANIAALLNIAPGAPTLRIAQVGYGADGKAVEDAVSWYRGDKYKYIGELEG